MRSGPLTEAVTSTLAGPLGGLPTRDSYLAPSRLGRRGRNCAGVRRALGSSNRCLPVLVSTLPRSWPKVVVVGRRVEAQIGRLRPLERASFPLVGTNRRGMPRGAPGNRRGRARRLPWLPSNWIGDPKQAWRRNHDVASLRFVAAPPVSIGLFLVGRLGARNRYRGRPARPRACATVSQQSSRTARDGSIERH